MTEGDKFWAGEYQASQRLWAQRARLAFNRGLYEQAARNQIKAAHHGRKARHMMRLEHYDWFDSKDKKHDKE